MNKKSLWIVFIVVFLVLVFLFVGSDRGWFLNGERKEDYLETDRFELGNSVSSQILMNLCAILGKNEDDQFCNLGISYYTKDGNLNYVGFRLSEGNYIYSPIDGELFIERLGFMDKKNIFRAIIGESLTFSEEEKMVYELNVVGDIDDAFIDNGEIIKVVKGQKIFKVNKVVNDNPNIWLRVINYIMDDDGKLVDVVDSNLLSQFIRNEEN